MGDEEFDQSLCECLFSHDFNMRRLLNLIRNGQSVCTDNECMDMVSPSQTGGPDLDSGVDNLTFTLFMFVAAVILYFMRPNSLRRRTRRRVAKTRHDDNNSNDRNDDGMAN